MARDPVIGVLSTQLFKLKCLKGPDSDKYTSTLIEARIMSAEDHKLLCERDATHSRDRSNDDDLNGSKRKSEYNLIAKWQFPMTRLPKPPFPHGECALDDLAALRKQVVSSPRLSHLTLISELTVADEINQGQRARYVNYLENSIPKEPRYLKTTTACVVKRQKKFTS